MSGALYHYENKLDCVDVSSEGEITEMTNNPIVIDKVELALSTIDCYDFNIFEIDKILNKETVLYVSYEIFTRLGLFDMIIDETKFTSFISCLVQGYDRNVSYHNDLHAADVFQTTFMMLTSGNIIKSLQLKDIDTFSTLLSALCHDFKHPGKNNMYHMNVRTDLALTYNGIDIY